MLHAQDVRDTLQNVTQNLASETVGGIIQKSFAMFDMRVCQHTNQVRSTTTNSTKLQFILINQSLEISNISAVPFISIRAALCSQLDNDQVPLDFTLIRAGKKPVIMLLCYFFFQQCKLVVSIDLSAAPNTLIFQAPPLFSGKHSDFTVVGNKTMSPSRIQGAASKNLIMF